MYNSNFDEFPPTYLPGFHFENEVKMMDYSYLGSTNLKVSRLSLGTAGFSHFYGEYSLEECEEVIKDALKSGVNYIDTSPWYGHGVSESNLGKCLKNIPRNAFYISTKVGRYEAEPKLMFDFSATKTRKSVEKSLERLGLEYLDLIQVHDVEFAPSLDVVLNETLPTLQEIVKEGKARFIGITGYPNSVLKEIIERSKIKISSVMSYARLTLIDSSLNEFIPFYKLKNIGVINASVHGMGLLTNTGPQSWHPASNNLKRCCADMAEYCEKNGVELGKLALHFALQQSGQDTIMCGVNNRKLLKMNLNVLFNGLNEKELQIYEEIKKRFLSRVPEKTHWEGVELEKIRTKLNMFK